MSDWYAERRWLWTESTRKSVGCCMRYLAMDRTYWRTRRAGHLSTAGLIRCKSVWLCPQCSGIIQLARADEIEVYAGLLEDPAMVTLTVRNDDDLAHVLGLVSKTWTVARDRLKLKRYVRVLEVTQRGKGWHPHYHVLVDGVNAWALVASWLASARKRGLVATADAQDVTPVYSVGDASRYLSLELLGARGKSNSHWQLLRRATMGDDLAQHMWAQVEDALPGRRQLIVSRTLKSLASGMIEERTDEDLICDDDTAPSVTIATFDGFEHGHLSARPYVLQDAYQRASQWQFSELRQLLATYGLEHCMLVPALTDRARAIPEQEQQLW